MIPSQGKPLQVISATLFGQDFNICSVKIITYLSVTSVLDLDNCLLPAVDTLRGSSGVTRSLHCLDICMASPMFTVSVCKA